MTAGAEYDWSETISRELRLPEIDSDHCVHSLLDRAQCQSCVQACPRQAWVLDEDTLGLDIEACDGCGLCVPACPTGAISIELPWVIRVLGGNLIALFACEKSPVDAATAAIPCVHALGLRPLLLLYSSGIRYLMLSRGDCESCERGCAERIEPRLDLLNGLLADRRKPGMKILDRSPAVWKKIYRTDEILTRGARLGRREFLRGGAASMRELMLDPFNRPEFRNLEPGELLPGNGNEETSWPCLPLLDSALCNGCDACMQLCPTGALSIEAATQNEPACYELNAARCNGCGICATVCENDAIRVMPGRAPRVRRIILSSGKCRACGNEFHRPAEQVGQPEALCRICSNKNHSQNLFQVLED